MCLGSRLDELPRRSSGSSRSKRTSASSGPSWAAERHSVRPMRSRQAPVSRADSCTWPCSVSRGWRASMKRRIAMLPTCRSSGTCSTATPSSAARSSAVPCGGAWNRNTARARSSSPASVSRSRAIVPQRVSSLGHGDAAEALLGRHAARVHVARDVVALPVLEREGSGRHARVAEDRDARAARRAARGGARAGPAPRARRATAPRARVVVAEDDEDARVGRRERVAQRREPGPEPVEQEVAAPDERTPGQQVAAQEHRGRPLRPDRREQLQVAVLAAVEVGNEEGEGRGTARRTAAAALRSRGAPRRRLPSSCPRGARAPPPRARPRSRRARPAPPRPAAPRRGARRAGPGPAASRSTSIQAATASPMPFLRALLEPRQQQHAAAVDQVVDRRRSRRSRAAARAPRSLAAKRSRSRRGK